MLYLIQFIRYCFMTIIYRWRQSFVYVLSSWSYIYKCNNYTKIRILLKKKCIWTVGVYSCFLWNLFIVFVVVFQIHSVLLAIVVWKKKKKTLIITNKQTKGLDFLKSEIKKFLIKWRTIIQQIWIQIKCVL